MSTSFTRELHADIPITAHMGITVIEAGADGAHLSAPLAPNSNHKNTAFGGSIHSVAVLTCWTLVSETLKAHGFSSDYIVIQNSAMEYMHPITGDFTAKAAWSSQAMKDKFLAGLKRKGLARAELEAVVECNGQACAAFRGRFVAQTAPQPPS